jgi:NDP-sugar pyrophosphorylase family protein
MKNAANAATLTPDINCDDNEIIYKDVVGLIPCSGTASRMSGIPKFLLPCKEGNLIDNSINIFKSNNIDDIYVSVSSENEHFIKNRDNIKYIVKNTNTMSETVKHLIEIKSKKYILIMPDTYFINDGNQKFNEIHQMYMLLNKFDIVVILWKIKEYQYGKLGQVDIDDTKVIDVMDKKHDCKYPYSWGIIGWTNQVNHLIDAKTPHVGYVLNEALKNKIEIGYILADTDYYDCGTPEEYFKMIKNCTTS